VTAGQHMTRTTGNGPGLPIPTGRKGFKAELDRLRERMHGLRFSRAGTGRARGRRTGWPGGGHWSTQPSGSMVTLPARTTIWESASA
jgi:hypothetical protein